jgi:hypothetical protein
MDRMVDHNGDEALGVNCFAGSGSRWKTRLN